MEYSEFKSKNSNKYPQHKYSDYIDQRSSCSNVFYPSKEDIVNKLKNMRCDGNIMLEPRLQEYIKKKKYYKENNIDPCISLEDQYQITNRDKRMLRDFFRGKKDIYNDCNRYQNKSSTKRRQYFPSKEYRDSDPKFNKIKIKKEKFDKPKNRGMFVPDKGKPLYEDPIQNVDIMDSRLLSNTYNKNLDNTFNKLQDNSYNNKQEHMKDKSECQYNKNFNGFKLNDTRFDPRTDPKMNPGFEKHNKYDSQYRIDPDPRNKFIIGDLLNNDNQTLGSNYCKFEDSSKKDFKLLDEDVSKILSKQKRYGDLARPTLSEKSNMDLTYIFI
jgi:hypothetical protein